MVEYVSLSFFGCMLIPTTCTIYPESPVLLHSQPIRFVKGYSEIVI